MLIFLMIAINIAQLFSSYNKLFLFFFKRFCIFLKNKDFYLNNI